MLTTAHIALAFAATCFAIAPLSAQSLVRARAEEVGMSSERLARLQPTLQRYVQRGEIAGVVTLVIRNGKVVALDSAGKADLEADEPMRSSTIFRVASMSKPVTSAAVLLLYEEGKLALNDPVSKYLPAFANMQVVIPDATDSSRSTLVPARRQITIRDLLTHRAGFSYGFSNAGPVGNAYRKAGVADGVAADELTLAENIERLARQPLVHEPGSRYHYSLGLDVAGRVVEVVSGQTLDAFMRERIFEPLGMKDTHFWVPDEKIVRIAVPYTLPAGQRLRPIRNPEAFGIAIMGGAGSRGSRNFSGGAGIYSTVTDYALFLQMLLNSGQLDGVRVLSPKIVELMTANHTADLATNSVGAGVGYGLGFTVVTDVGAFGAPSTPGSYSHGGIYGTTAWVDPSEGLVAVMLIQRYPTTGLTVGNAVRGVVYQAIMSPQSIQAAASPKTK
jgi:CubicO group peptidase (beta-lactamase class C family)